MMVIGMDMVAVRIMVGVMIVGMVVVMVVMGVVVMVDKVGMWRVCLMFVTRMNASSWSNLGRVIAMG